MLFFQIEKENKMEKIIYNAILMLLLSIEMMAHGAISIVNTKDMVSINDFGAIPNDNKDDTEAIRKALNINGHIIMNRGTYNVHGIVRLGKQTIIDGNSSKFLSTLDTTNGGRTSKNILTLQGDSIVIKHLTLDGAYTNGNAIKQDNVSSLLHIYNSKNILLEGIKTINYSSNWWSSKKFNLSQLNSNHKMDMYHVIYIGFSDNITIRNMEQIGNINTEGLLIYESDNIFLEGFKSFNSPKIWTSLHIIASDNISMNSIAIGDGSINQGGSSINFIANHHFIIKNTKTTTKQGFDISNEIKVKGFSGRVIRDTSYGIFENCYFKGQRALYGYPTIDKIEDIVFKDTTFISTKDGSASWGARIERGGDIKFEHCTFGSKNFKTFGLIMGDSREISISNSQFINPSIGLYIFGKTFGNIKLENNTFSGDSYSPVSFSCPKSYTSKGKVEELYLNNNKAVGELNDNKFYKIKKNFKIEKIIE